MIWPFVAVWVSGFLMGIAVTMRKPKTNVAGQGEAPTRPPRPAAPYCEGWSGRMDEHPDGPPGCGGCT